MKIQNDMGFYNLHAYLKDLNDLPNDRFIGDKFQGRKTLRDSFLHEEKEEEAMSVKEVRETFIEGMICG